MRIVPTRTPIAAQIRAALLAGLMAAPLGACGPQHRLPEPGSAAV
jgi:hypothetical protein